jgi:hypothetical protein
VDSSWQRLLSSTDGRCGNWAPFFREVLREGGVTNGVSELNVTPNINIGDDNSQTGILVNRFLFTAGAEEIYMIPDFTTENNNTFYINTAFFNNNTLNWTPAIAGVFAADLDGIAGQGNPDPRPIFPDHQLVLAPSFNGATTFYDPSYGTTYNTLLQFQQQSLAAIWSTKLVDNGNGTKTQEFVIRPIDPQSDVTLIH